MAGWPEPATKKELHLPLAGALRHFYAIHLPPARLPLAGLPIPVEPASILVTTCQPASGRRVFEFYLFLRTGFEPTCRDGEDRSTYAPYRASALKERCVPCF